MHPNLVVPDVLFYLRCHAALVWILFPIFVAVSNFVSVLQPTCETGYSNYGFIVVLFVILHHLRAESCAWTATKSLLAPPELSVMRQLGALQRRRRLVLLGILEDLDIYTDLTFPFIAYDCDVMLTEQWLQSWNIVPIVGGFVVSILERLRFWGCAAIFVAFVNVAGLIGLCQLLFTKQDRDAANIDDKTAAGPPRLKGDVFFSIARFAETAVMPSIANLCEEMGLQRRWTFDANEAHGGAKALVKARQDAVWGKISRKDLHTFELQNQEEQGRVDKAGERYWIILLIGKVLVGNAAQLWLQASFFQLSFGTLGRQAMYKLIASMLFSGLQVLARSSSAAVKLGGVGVVFALLNVFIIAWAGAKIYYAFHCEEHVWNISSGCVNIHA